MTGINFLSNLFNNKNVHSFVVKVYFSYKPTNENSHVTFLHAPAGTKGGVS